MKNNEEKQSGKEIMSNIFSKASDIGKKVADNVQKGTQSLAEKAKISHHDYKMKNHTHQIQLFSAVQMLFPDQIFLRYYSFL